MLLQRWLAHENDDCAAMNTLFAVFGVNSALGRYADNFAYNNPPYAGWLGERAVDCMADWTVQIQTRSSAACEIIACGLVRANPKAARLPLTGETKTALILYYREKLQLLSQIHGLVDDGRRRTVQRHIRATLEVLYTLEKTATIFRDDAAS